jgi:hypothetical protein
MGWGRRKIGIDLVWFDLVWEWEEGPGGLGGNKLLG